MPEGRAERAVEAPAKSIDGAERGGMLTSVMASAHVGIWTTGKLVLCPKRKLL